MNNISAKLDAIPLPKTRDRIPPIRPEVLAAKLQDIHDLKYPEILSEIEEHPRLVELMWFIQSMSHQPGGLELFTRDFLKVFPQAIEPPIMREIGRPDSGFYRLKDVLAIWKAVDRYSGTNDLPESIDTWLFERLLNEDVEKIQEAEERGLASTLNIIHKLTPDFFEDKILRLGLKALPYNMAALCNESDREFEWLVQRWEDVFYLDLIPLLFKMMDHHAEKVSRNLARTKVAALVFDELDYAYSAQKPVAIWGDSRFGKTKAVSTWCEMYPGRARLVTVPIDSNRDSDFFEAHAEALGIAYTEKTPVQELKRQVEFILRHSRLFLAYDEAHGLLPMVYSQTTPPKRLNWVRSRVIDHGIGCAFFATRQTYNTSLSKFVRKTGYVMEQWLGRMDKPLILPQDMDFKDLRAAGRVNFPDIDDDILDLVAAKSMQSEGYLANFELLLKRAQFYAHKEGRSQLTVEDVEKAYNRNFGDTLAPGTRPSKVSRKGSENGAATAVQRPSQPVAPDRTAAHRNTPAEIESDRSGTIDPLGRGISRAVTPTDDRPGSESPDVESCLA